MRRIHIKAVLVSTLLVLVLSILAGLGLMFVQGVLLAFDGQTEDQILQALVAMDDDDVYLAWSLVLGGLACILGGYVAARIARSYPYFNGLAVGLLTALVGLFFWDDFSLLFHLASVVVTLGCCVLGAHWAAMRRVAGA